MNVFQSGEISTLSDCVLTVQSVDFVSWEFFIVRNRGAKTQRHEQHTIFQQSSRIQACCVLLKSSKINFK